MDAKIFSLGENVVISRPSSCDIVMTGCYVDEFTVETDLGGRNQAHCRISSLGEVRFFHESNPIDHLIASVSILSNFTSEQLLAELNRRSIERMEIVKQK